MPHCTDQPRGLSVSVVCCQVRAEITSKEKEEEDMMEKAQKEVKYVSPPPH